MFRPNRTTIIGLLLLIAIVWWRGKARQLRRLSYRIDLLERELFPEWFPAPPPKPANSYNEVIDRWQTATNYNQVFPAYDSFIADLPTVPCGICGNRIRIELVNVGAQIRFSTGTLLSSRCQNCSLYARTEIPYSDLVRSNLTHSGVMAGYIQEHAEKIRNAKQLLLFQGAEGEGYPYGNHQGNLR